MDNNGIPHSSIKSSLGHHISVLNRSLHMWINSQLEEMGLGSGQFHYLKCIGDNEGITQKELSRRIVVDKATTAKTVRKLEGGGFIEVCKNQTDGRVHNLFLTEKGRSILPELKRILKSTIAILEEGMDEAEKAAVRNLLVKMQENIALRLGSAERIEFQQEESDE